jgi:hypothetical protein
VNVTAPVKGVRFDQETHSVPSTPGPWGIAGWTKDERAMLVYDRFDIWELDPMGVRAPINVTDGAGRAVEMTLRLVNLDPDEDRMIDPAKPLLLRAFSERTKASGYYRDQLGATRARFDLVLANILARPLMALAPLLAARVKPGGMLALAWLLDSQAESIAAVYAPGCLLQTVRSLDGWALLAGVRVR